MREPLHDTLIGLQRAHAEILSRMPIREIVDALGGTSAVLSRWMEEWESGRVGEWGNGRVGDAPNGEGDLASPADHPVTPSPTLPLSHSPTQLAPGMRALLSGLSREALWALLEEEFGDPEVLDGFRARAGGGRRRALGPAVTAHFFAGNTPLLAWPALAACLLVKSAAFGKLSRGETEWAGVFTRALDEVSPDLARCVALETWPGGTRDLDALLCSEADAVAAYGSDATLEQIHSLVPVSVPFHGFGHRVSIGLVLRGADEESAAAGLARDVLLFDQEGCLSTAMLFIEGDTGDAARFGEHLAGALEQQACAWALPPREAESAAQVRAAREVALFAEGARVWGDPGLRWSVILAPGAAPEPTCSACVVPLHPLPDLDALPALLGPLRRHLQGAALAAPPERVPAAAEALARAGVNRICAPGELQSPPFSWHHDGRLVLASLVRWTDLELPDVP